MKCKQLTLGTGGENPPPIYHSSAQSLSRAQLFATPKTVAHQASLCITNSQSLFKVMFIQVCDTIQTYHPLSSSSPPTFNLSHHQCLFQ